MGKTKINEINLDDYRRETADKLDAVTTSVHLDRKHMDFIRQNNINLSRLVRDVIDKIMEAKNDNEKS